LALAALTLAACDSPLPGGKPSTPKELTAMDAAKQARGTIFLGSGGRIWKLRDGKLTAVTGTDRKLAHPTTTPDGARTAVAIMGSGHSEIAVGGADFADLAPLTIAPKDPHQASIDIKPALSPDGQRVAFMSDRSKCCTDEAIWEGPYKPYKPRQVSTPPDVSGGDDAPTYLPGGNALVFVAWRPVAGDTRVVRAGLQQAAVPVGKPKTLLAPSDSDLLDPSPNPDGTRLAFVRRHADTGDAEVGNIDGTAASQLTSFGDVRQPVFAPDGQSVVFISQHGGTLDLWQIAADGKGDPKRLTWGADLDANSRPAWIN
jgi:Tol biopolymer transport system component